MASGINSKHRAAFNEEDQQSGGRWFKSYCGQPLKDGSGNRGFVTNFRWHILTLEYKGADASVDKPEIGIEFIWLQTVER